MVLCLKAMLLGALCALCYDLIRIFRRIVSHGIIWITIEDALFWIFVGIQLFILFTEGNAGKVRGFMIFFLLLGAVLYVVFIGNPVICHMSKGICRMKKRLKKRWKEVTMKLTCRKKN